ncbi:hypothetical protein I7I50_00939 [Histoplasma capsulatum G186AR]|uniref:Uncharacterized protein n=1 Tax=Ajellomyces capsulatus TaxID=5037 RepID=A0A8H7YJM4_AJECA|nr:hypothetical protein I7I52_08205 [Histoplasma capsulatum]QSS72940.1 hypothetical protein I7I50_00939 [Histoplasma capsulatum G186AR]
MLFLDLCSRSAGVQHAYIVPSQECGPTKAGAKTEKASTSRTRFDETKLPSICKRTTDGSGSLTKLQYHSKKEPIS